jgi:hypothetical protein
MKERYLGMKKYCVFEADGSLFCITENYDLAVEFSSQPGWSFCPL